MGATSFALILLATALAQAPVAYPPAPKENPDRFSGKSAFYFQKDLGGNELLDEDAMIVEALFVIKKKITQNNTATVRAMGSVISSASYDSARTRAIMISGATTTINNPGSGGLGVGWTYSPKDWSFGLRGTIGFESAYRTRGLGLDISHTFNDSNTTLSLMLQGYYDSVRMIRFDGTTNEETKRTTLSAEMGWTQTVSPKTIANLTVNFTEQLGFLATSYGFVRIGPRETALTGPDTRGAFDTYEAAPPQRHRGSATLRVKRALDSESVIEGSYRFYLDSWGVQGNTANLIYTRYLFHRLMSISPGYRFYVQSPASFYAKRFDAPAQYMTSDPDLGGFFGHMASVNFRFPNVRFFWLADYDLGVNFYHRTDGIEMFWLTVGFDVAYWPTHSPSLVSP